jgi:hypothetical protein
MAKHGKEEDRKIHKDFTLNEFDVFTLDMQCVGAVLERDDIVKELKRRANDVKELSDFAPGGKLDSSVEWAILSYGLEMAIKITQKMPQLDERYTCAECGA